VNADDLMVPVGFEYLPAAVRPARS
jgi:hypothetical protein